MQAVTRLNNLGFWSCCGKIYNLSASCSAGCKPTQLVMMMMLLRHAAAAAADQ